MKGKIADALAAKASAKLGAKVDPNALLASAEKVKRAPRRHRPWIVLRELGRNFIRFKFGLPV